jgi:hypothetical protein
MYKLAICGKANSGKDTTASIILEELSILENRSIVHATMAFADPIKEIILTMFPNAKREFLYGASSFRSEKILGAKNKLGEDLTYRQALIDIGTMAREYNPKIWVECFDKRVQSILEKNKSLPDQLQTQMILSTDLRFREEFDYLYNNNYFIIKLNRKKHSIINDKSETDQEGFSNFNFTIDNNGTLLDLRAQIKENLIPELKNVM